MGFSSVKSSGSSAETGLENETGENAPTAAGIIQSIKDRITIRQQSPLP